MNNIRVIRIYDGDTTLLYTVTPYTAEVRLGQIMSESRYLRKSKLHHQINNIVEAGGTPKAEVIAECKTRDEVTLIINQHRTAKSKEEKKPVRRKRTTKSQKK